MVQIISSIASWLLASLIGAGFTLFPFLANQQLLSDKIARLSSQQPQHASSTNSVHPPSPDQTPDWAFPFSISHGEKYERPCTTPTANQLDYCNTSLSDADRIAWLLDNLTPPEKISLLGNQAWAIPRIGLPHYNWWSESLHGVAASCCPGIRFRSTSFPQVCTTAASYNQTLWSEIGTAIGDEAIEHYHRLQDVPGLTYWSPNVNLFRDPRWGRGQEVPGEDPYLNGQYAKALIPAMQYKTTTTGGGGDDNTSPRIAAACKHFAAYSVETGRMAFNAIVDERDMEESYLPAFRQCVESGVLGFMCSYNAINGVPSCANENLLTRKLRQEWGFTGYVTGDCGAVGNVYPSHHYTNSTTQGVAAAFRAGVDTDCGGDMQMHGRAALDAGYLTMDDIDRALKNLLTVQFRLGYYNPPSATKRRTRKTTTPLQHKHIQQPQELEPRLQDQVHMHNELALEAARQGIVLLKNGHGNATTSDRPLPLSPSKHSRIALLGPNADAAYTMLGNYFGIPPFIISPKQGLEDLNTVQVTYLPGCKVTDPTISSSKEELCVAATYTDATILVMGSDGRVENEGRDRTSITLPGQGQVELIDLVTSCAKMDGRNRPVVLIIMSGGPIDLSPYKDHESIDAILYVGYPGQAGGTAIAEVLYGQTNPSGRLTTTIYPQKFAEQVTMADMRMRPSGSFPGRTYRYYNGDVVFPFGFGMTYSRFEKQLSVVENSEQSEYGSNLVKVAAEIANHGPLDGAYSVLLFHSRPNAGREGNPLRSLVAFEKIFLTVGGRKIVSFMVNIDAVSGGGATQREPGVHRFSLAADEASTGTGTSTSSTMNEVFYEVP